MPYTYTSLKTGKIFFLHGAPSKNGKSLLYYFGATLKPEFALTAIPDGKEIVENNYGVPFLRRKK